MKRCPYCVEEIQDEAIKCKHCGEFLDGPRPPRVLEKQGPWYFRTWVIVVALGSAGPLALPMVWWHPSLKPVWKISISLGTFVLTWLLYRSMVESFRMIHDMMETLQVM